MSRAGFSIRKLINQRRTWPESDSDNEDAFECSSAKTIRMQYELEQYQQQQLQKELRHAHKGRSSWMSSNSSPKRKTYKKVPKPIVVVEHNSDGVVLHSGSASRRISTPLPASALSGLVSPGTPHSNSSNSSLSSCSGGDRKQRHQGHQRHHSDSKAVPSAAAGTPSKPRLSTPTMTAGWVSPRGGALCPVATPTWATKNPSHDGRSFLIPASPSPGLARGNQDGTTSPQPTSATNFSHTSHIKMPTTTKAPLNSADNTTDKKSVAMHSHQQRNPRQGNSAESYTLYPPMTEDAKDRKVGGREAPRAVKTPSKTSDEDENTFEKILEGKDYQDCDHLPDNVQQLIWETDEAFKAVGTALAEARLASQSHPQSKELQEQVQQLQRASQALEIQTKSLDTTLLQTLPSTTYQAPVSRARKDSVVTSPISPTPGRGSISSHPRKNKSSPVSSSDNMLRSPTHATSIKKAKRKSPARPKTPRSATTPTPTTTTWPDTPAPTAKASTFGPSASSAESGGSTAQRQQNSYISLSRWNLKADNVTEKLFNGSRGRFGFHKIEADEVVTPSQVQQYRQSRIAKAEAEAQAETRRSNSNESLRSTAGSFGAVTDSNSVNTPVEPFHLQDLPSRIGNQGPNLGVLSPVAEVLTPKSLTFDLDQDTPGKPDSAEPKTPMTATRHPKQEQTPLATPPPTPPQPSPSASATRFSATTPSPEEDTSTFFKSHSFPDPPVKESPQRPTHKRGNSSGSRVPILPTIPEVRITSPPSQDSYPKSQNGRRPSEMHMDQPSPRLSPLETPIFEEDDEYLFFKSAPFTVNMPSFEHGRIRLAKADLVNAGTINSLESKLLSSPDETLDWTAFQMAILGGAGDFFSDPSDFCARDAEEDLVDDLCDWLEGFGLPSDALGALTKSEEKPPAMLPVMPYAPAHVSAISPPGSGSRSFHDPSHNHSINRIVNGSISSSCSDSARSSGEVSEEVQEMLQSQSMPIPIQSEHPSGFWNTRPFDAARFYTGGPIKRWTLEGHPKRYQGPGIDVDKANMLQRGSPKPSPEGVDGKRVKLRSGVDSLPQSPMLDLVMTTAVDGSKEFVPMGYNLGHDLGDFLKWESENVYATAFYGSD